MAVERLTSDDYPHPPMRRLRVYAFDPQASIELDSAVINDAVIALPWESAWEDPLEIGPVNDYVEVIDYDPACGVFYAPVDLNHPVLLAQDGLPPSEGRPQFHQQMVFAVVMRTIRTFERALGRPVLWAGVPDFRGPDRNFTKRLRIYPHALREANAYYSPAKRALLFGYFKAQAAPASADAVIAADDGHWVFTCLSQDIVAHETTHAILHGVYRRSVNASNVDSLAFHEAFADIVALLQHFSLTQVVEHQISRSRGSLRVGNLLTGLASQFGHATGRQGALRYALETIAAEGAAPGGVATLADTREPHARGGILVAAIFDAFVTIYERRTADLFRIAGAQLAGGGVLSPDLVARLANEAAKAADHVLRMCVRALDYLPPVDTRFGEYLRAIITADNDLVADDPMRYRVAMVEAFRKRGIAVPGSISMAPDSLLWEDPDPRDWPAAPEALTELFGDLLSTLILDAQFGRRFPAGARANAVYVPQTGSRRNLRELTMQITDYNQACIHDWLNTASDARDRPEWEALLGIKLLPDPADRAINTWEADDPEVKANRRTAGMPRVEVHSARVARRTGPDGQDVQQLVVQLLQKRRGYFSDADQALATAGDRAALGDRWARPDFWFRGGATIHIDLRDGRLRRVIRKRIDNDRRLAEERAFLTGNAMGRAVRGADAGAAAAAASVAAEPFAFVHRSMG